MASLQLCGVCNGTHKTHKEWREHMDKKLQGTISPAAFKRCSQCGERGGWNYFFNVELRRNFKRWDEFNKCYETEETTSNNLDDKDLSVEDDDYNGFGFEEENGGDYES